MVEAYSAPEEHFADQRVRVALWLERYLAIYGTRLTDSAGTLDDQFVSLVEAVAAHARELRQDSALAARFRSPEAVAHALRDLDAHVAARLAATPSEPPLARAARRFGLDPASADLLLAVTAFQSSLDLARLFRFAWADFQQQQPTVGFLLDLLAPGAASRGALLAALDERAPLRAHGLLDLRPARPWDGPTPLIFQRVRVPDALALTLAGHRPEPDPKALRAAATDRALHPIAAQGRARRELAAVLTRSAGPTPVVALLGENGSGRTSVAAEVVSPLRVVVVALPDAPSLPERAAALRERLAAVALDGALPLIDLDGEGLGPERATRELLADVLGAPWGLVLARARDGHVLDQLGLEGPRVAVLPPTPDEQLQLWRQAMGGQGQPWLDEVARTYQLSPGRLAAAARAARSGEERPGRDAIIVGIRRQLPPEVARLADVVETTQGWDDLVLPPDSKDELRRLVATARHRHLVWETWGFARRMPTGRSLSALFHGPPGTGKTLAATVVARSLGKELLRVDLSRVVDKYIGETEKHLAALFDHAESAQAVLLFDEADALFARRTEVKSSNDRYANLEVNYLLQRVERYTGISLLTTNFHESLDEALARRIAVKVRFPMPNAVERELLWRRMLPDEAPRSADIDFVELAARFELAGGHIRNAVLRAAFDAAERGVPIDYDILWRGAVDTCRELGRVVTAEMLVPWR